MLRATIMRGLAGLACCFAGAASAAEVVSHAFPAIAGLAQSGGSSALVTAGEATVGSASSANFGTGSGMLTTLDTQAPTGSLLGAQGVQGQNAVVEAILEDNVGIRSADLTYEVGGSLLRTVAMQAVGTPGRFEALIPAADVTERGIRYFVTARDAFRAVTFPPNAPEITAHLSVDVNNLTFFSLPQRRYELLGAPIIPDDADPLDVFNELGSYDPVNWRYGIFNGTDYDEFPDAADANPGQGFWIISKDAVTINVSGSSSRIDRNARITLHEGWNQIANPFAFPVDFADVALPLEVERNLVGWDSGSGGFENQRATLEPRRGYFIKNNGAAGLFIEIPPVGSGVNPAPGAHGLAEEDLGWSVHVRAEGEGFTDTGNRMGVRAGATLEKDAFDFSETPPPPEGYVRLSFVEEASGARLLTDFRDPLATGHVWTMVAESDREGPVSVRFETEAPPPHGWVLVAMDEKGILETNLLEKDRLEGRLAPGVPKVWRVVAGPPSFVNETREAVQEPFLAGTSLDGPSPNPARAGTGTTVVMSVSAPTTASLRVFDAGGRLVRTLHAGAIGRGVHRFAWDTRDASGAMAAAGVYFVQTFGPTFHEVRKLVLLR